jgi:hypothetical protein
MKLMEREEELLREKKKKKRKKSNKLNSPENLETPQHQ